MGPFVDHAINRLNEALAADSDAINSLFKVHVFCNKKLAKHPTIQVNSRKSTMDNAGHIDVFDIGVLGLINGILGIDKSGNGHIAMMVDNRTGKIKQFCRYLTPKESSNG